MGDIAKTSPECHLPCASISMNGNCNNSAVPPNVSHSGSSFFRQEKTPQVVDCIRFTDTDHYYAKADNSGDTAVEFAYSRISCSVHTAAWELPSSSGYHFLHWHCTSLKHHSIFPNLILFLHNWRVPEVRCGRRLYPIYRRWLVRLHKQQRVL